MDLIGKLDKMKVVDLRNELQTRGLDTKGVKAVLVERLRAYLENGGSSGNGDAGGGELPLTPSRRGRRTRSMTRSPSPSIINRTEKNLETLEEESSTAQNDDVSSQEVSQDCDHVTENHIMPNIVETEGEDKNSKETSPEKDSTDLEGDAVVPTDEDTMAATENIEADNRTTYVEDSLSDNNDEKIISKETYKEEDESTKQQQQDEEKKEDSHTENLDGDTEENPTAEKGDHEEDKDNRHENLTSEKLELGEKNNRDTEKHNDKEPNSPHSRSCSIERDPKRESRSRSRSHSAESSGSRSRSRSPRSRSRSRSNSKEKENDEKSLSDSRSRTRSRSPRRRSGTGKEQSPNRDKDEASNPEDEPTFEENQFGLSWYDSDLHLRIDPVTFTTAKPLHSDVYALVWSGVRTNYGARQGKVAFEVRISEECPLNRGHTFRDEPFVSGFRVGFSLPNTPLLLGEAENSFAYCESGRKATKTEFTDYGQPFKLDDVIGCYLDLESEPCNIRYTLNGVDLGVAFEFDKAILGENEALFPHILTKGYEFHVNFADNENLLVNTERKVRRIRKKKIIESKSEDEKKENDDDNKEVSENPESIEEKKIEDELNKEANDEDKSEITEDIKKPEISEETEMKSAENNSSADQVSKEEETTESSDKTDCNEKLLEEAAERTEMSNKTSEANGETKSEAEAEATAERKTDEGPSPSKRARLSGEKRDYRQKSVEPESEYEDVEPEPRETMQLLPGYELIALIPEEQYIPGRQRPESRKDCEVILLVGLPGSGKTTWTLKRMAEQPEKHYYVIGADALIAKMTIDGKPRKEVHKGRWERVFEQCLGSLTTLEDIAAKRRRNFILDQTNAYASVQRRKMKGFGDFKRIAVICVPNDEELNKRIADKKDKGNEITIRDTTLNNLRANFALPSMEFGWFDEIIYTDLNNEEAKEEVKKYNEKGKKALDVQRIQRERMNRRGGDKYRRDDRRRRFDGQDRRRTVGGVPGAGGGAFGGGPGGGDYRYRDQRRNDRRSAMPMGPVGRGGGGTFRQGGSRWSNVSVGGYTHGGGGGQGYGHGYAGQGAGGNHDYRGYRGGGVGGGYRDDRGYGANSGPRGYDNRNQRYSVAGTAGGQQGWSQNPRHRYDDRYQRTGGGGSGRYDGGGGGRDYRDNRDHRSSGSGGGGDRNRNSGFRSGGGSNQQRDFRHGHRDTTVDSRGGFEKSAVSYTDNSGTTGMSGYDASQQINTIRNDNQQSGSQSGGKWAGFSQQNQNQAQSAQQQTTMTNNWQQYQQPPPNMANYQHQTQQQYWNYNQMQGYSQQVATTQQQQQWQNTDPNQQQQWMAWWQQQGAQQIPQNESNQYWSQYSYNTASNTSQSAAPAETISSISTVTAGNSSVNK